MTPKNEALAFRIWQYCTPIGWDCTSVEVAHAIDVSHIRVCEILNTKKWTTRLRSTHRRKGVGKAHSGTLSGESLAARRELESDFRRDGIIR